jgi:hypothetical protein
MLLYALMFSAGALWALILLTVVSICVAAGRADREIERQAKRSYLRRVV